jgi:hypothetical protein
MMCTVNVSVMEGRRQCIPMLWDWLPGSEIAFIVQALGCEYRYAGSCLQGVCVCAGEHAFFSINHNTRRLPIYRGGQEARN